MARKRREDLREGSLAQRVSDLVDHTSSLALLALCLLLFGGAAVAGVAMVSRLGSIGWFLYAVVMGTFALVFGPVIASAVTLRQRGSKRHREARDRRLEEQRKKFSASLSGTAHLRDDDD